MFNAAAGDSEDFSVDDSAAAGFFRETMNWEMIPPWDPDRSSRTGPSAAVVEGVEEDVDERTATQRTGSPSERNWLERAYSSRKFSSLVVLE